jgi:gluconolactonase
MRSTKAFALVLLLSACGQGSGGNPPATGGEGGGEAGAGGEGGGGSGGRGGTGGQAGRGGAGGAGGTSGAGGTAGAGPVDAGAADTAPAAGPDASPDAGEPTPDMAPAARPLCPPGPFEAPKVGERKNICPGFRVKYNWNEGPTWVPSQKAFFFSNFVVGASGPGDMIKYDPATDKCEVFIEGNGCNGLTVDKDGFVLAACHTPRALLKFDLATKKSTVLVDMVEGKKLDSPNDVVAHPNGTIYFSNATYELGGRPQGLGTALLRVDPAGMVHVVARGGINPLGMSPDLKRLYAMGGYWDLDEQGVPVKKAGSFTLGGDGIAVDCGGNVYTNSGAIMNPQNQMVGRYPGGTNMGFGGEDGKTLLVVGGREMHTVQMNLPGLP